MRTLITAETLSAITLHAVLHSRYKVLSTGRWTQGHTSYHRCCQGEGSGVGPIERLTSFNADLWCHSGHKTGVNVAKNTGQMPQGSHKKAVNKRTKIEINNKLSKWKLFCCGLMHLINVTSLISTPFSPHRVKKTFWSFDLSGGWTRNVSGKHLLRLFDVGWRRTGRCGNSKRANRDPQEHTHPWWQAARWDLTLIAARRLTSCLLVGERRSCPLSCGAESVRTAGKTRYRISANKRAAH